MGLLEPYRGTFHSAKSASDKIDAASILAGCDAVDALATKLHGLGMRVSSDMGSVTPNNLSFDGITVTEILGDSVQSIDGCEGYITGSTASIREKTIAEYNMLQQQYNEEAEALDKEAWSNHEAFLAAHAGETGDFYE
jgi:hypothetical protein